MPSYCDPWRTCLLGSKSTTTWKETSLGGTVTKFSKDRQKYFLAVFCCQRSWNLNAFSYFLCFLIKECTERVSLEKPRRKHARGAEYRYYCQQREAQQDSQLIWGLEEEQGCQFTTVLQNLNGNKMAQIQLRMDGGQTATIDLSPFNSPPKNLSSLDPLATAYSIKTNKPLGKKTNKNKPQRQLLLSPFHLVTSSLSSITSYMASLQATRFCLF